MPRPKSLKPSYCHAKDTGRAYVQLNDRRVYLGKYGTQESRDEYDRIIGEWIAAGRGEKPTAKAAVEAFQVAHLIVKFWRHARDYYRMADGKTAAEAFNYRDALRPVLRLYGRTPAAAFGPLAIRAVRDEMIRLGWCRTYINRQVLRIKSVFRWAAGTELLPASVYESLRAVEGLRAGRSDAKESSPVRPVVESHAEAIFAFLSPQVKAMVELQALTGMRPGEACAMRGCDIDTTGKPWKYRPASHKTQHHGHERVIDLGPKARQVVELFLQPDLQAHLFSPSEATETRRRLRQRTTPLTCGNVTGSNRKRAPKRPAGTRYDVAAYRRAIQRACERAFPPPDRLQRLRVPAAGRKRKATRWETRREWRTRLGVERWAELRAHLAKHQFHPHQLRHTAATRWRAEFGAEATLVLLGDRTTRMVDVYAEKDRQTATTIMEKIG